MSEAPAHSILNDLLGPDPERRTVVLHHVRSAPGAMAALRPHLYKRLDDDAADRLGPARLIRDLYDDTRPLAGVVAQAMRGADPDDEVRDVVRELPTLGVPQLLIECAFTRPALFSDLLEGSPRWITRVLISAGRPGILTLRLFVAELPDPLLHQVAPVIADEAASSPHDLSPLVLPLSAVRLRPLARLEVGLALWRLTWRVDTEWVEWLLGTRSWSLTDLLAEALVEMLPICPAVEPLLPPVFAAASYLWERQERVAYAVRRMFDLGPRGVKLLAAADPHFDHRHAHFRAEVLAAAAGSAHLSRTFLPKALRVIERHDSNGGALALEAFRAACRVVATVGREAKDVVPRVLDIAETDAAVVPEAVAAISAMGVESAALRGQLVERIVRLAKAADVGLAGTAANLLLWGCIETLAGGNPEWLPGLVSRDHDGSLAVRACLADVFERMPNERRDRLAEAVAPLLADLRYDCRTEAARWLVELLRERAWPWLVAALTVPHANWTATEAFRWLPTDSCAAVAAELTPLLTDPNPQIAANAMAASEALNLVG